VFLTCTILHVSETEIRNELDITLDLRSVNLLATALLRISEQSLLKFPLRDVTNVHCWAATLPPPSLDSRGVRVAGTQSPLSLTDLVASVTAANLNITCTDGGCSSPGFVDLSKLLQTQEAQEDSTRVANDLVEYATRLLGGEFLQVKIDRFLNEAPRKCPHSPLYLPNATDPKYEPFATPETKGDVQLLVLVFVSAICLLFAVLMVLLVIRLIVRRRHKKFVLTLSRDRALRLLAAQRQERAIEKSIDENTVAMYKSPDIPILARVLVPLSIFGCIGFFLSAHISVAASVVSSHCLGR
jgi:hypothetical protein